jgi:hypothetical protein
MIWGIGLFVAAFLWWLRDRGRVRIAKRMKMAKIQRGRAGF